VPRAQLELIDALHRCESRRRSSTRGANVETLRHLAHVLCIRDRELRIEAAARIAKLVPIDDVADGEAPHASAFGHDSANTVDARYQGKLRRAGFAP
jgi:hypothetical protein